MANRYNKYQQVDYVHLPVEAYQMALASEESRRMSELAAAKQQYDGLNAIQASWNPDRELKDEVMNQITSRIGALAGKNLRSQDAMMEINKLVNDPAAIKTLSEIYGNTLIKQAADKDNKAHIDEYGTDINTLSYIDQGNAYNKQGKEGFKAGFLGDFQAGKFLDIAGEARTAMDKAINSGWKKDYVSNMWINRQSGTGLKLEDLLAQVNPVLRDPKYKRQLERYVYQEMRNYGDPANPNQAYGNYNKANMQALAEGATEATASLNKLLAEKKRLGNRSLDKQIEDTRRDIADYNSRIRKYQEDGDRGGAMRDDVLHKLAMAAVTPKVNWSTEDLMEANPYGLEWAKQQNRKELLKMAEPPPYEYTQFPEESGPTALMQRSIIQDFNKKFATLDVRSGKERNTEASQIYMSGTGVSTGFGKGLYAAPTAGKDVTENDPKLMDFADFLGKNGWMVDKELLKLKGTTPASAKEFKKVQRLHGLIKNGAASRNVATTSLDVAIIADPMKFSQYLVRLIGAAGNNVTDQNGNPVPFSKVFGEVDKDGVNHSKIMNAISDGIMSGVLNPSSRKWAISGLDGKGVYFVNPDLNTQRLLDKDGDLFDPVGNIGYSHRGAWDEKTKSVLPYRTIGSFTKDGGYNQGMFQAVDPRAVGLSTPDADKVVNRLLGTNASLNLDEKIGKDEARIFFRDGNIVRSVPYANYMMDKTHYDEKWGVNTYNTITLIRRGDNKIDIVKPSNITSYELINATANEIMGGPLNNLLEGNTKETNERMERVRRAAESIQ